MNRMSIWDKTLTRCRLMNLSGVIDLVRMDQRGRVQAIAMMPGSFHENTCENFKFDLSNKKNDWKLNEGFSSMKTDSISKDKRDEKVKHLNIWQFWSAWGLPWVNRLSSAHPLNWTILVSSIKYLNKTSKTNKSSFKRPPPPLI